MSNHGVVSSLLDDMQVTGGADVKSIQDRINRLNPGVEPDDSASTQPNQQPVTTEAQHSPLPPIAPELPPIDTMTEYKYDYQTQPRRQQRQPKPVITFNAPRKAEIGIIDRVCSIFKYFIAAAIIFLFFSLPAVDSFLKIYLKSTFMKIELYRMALKALLAGIMFTTVNSTLL